MENKEIIELLKASQNDIDEVCELCRKVAEHNPESHWSEDYPNRKFLENDIKRGELYKVIKSGKIISILSIKPLDIKNDGDFWSEDLKNTCMLGRFCVSPEYQGKGFGRAIVAATIKKAKESGYNSAVFHAIKTNFSALHIYDTIGFKRVGEINEYGEDFICYEIKL